MLETENLKHEIKSDKLELTRAYVPFQKPNKMYSPEEGLIKGTIYPDLYKPYNETKCDCSHYL